MDGEGGGNAIELLLRMDILYKNYDRDFITC